MGELAVESIALSALLSLAALVTLIVIAVRLYNNRVLRREGLVWLQAMRVLITHLQRHRGLSSGFLCGDLSLGQPLEEVQRHISRDFSHIASDGTWIAQLELWQNITQHWARLAGSYSRLPIARSIEQHNRLIQSALALTDEIALRYRLHTGGGRQMWRELLSLAEDLGQLRALGTAVVTQAQNPQSQSERPSLDGVQRALRRVRRSLERAEGGRRLDENTQACVEDLLRFVEATLLRGSITVSSADFYRTATEAVEVVYNHFDSELMSVVRRLRP